MTFNKKYFDVLGIDPTDDHGIIKKAYRKQALKYHPDRNKDPLAHFKFIEVTEAYEILTGQGKSSDGASRVRTPEEILAEKMERARARYQKYKAEEKRKDRLYYKKVATGWKWNLFKCCAIYTSIFTILLAIDYFADGKTETIVENEVIYDRRGRSIKVQNERFNIGTHDFWWATTSHPKQGNRSLIFNDLKSVSITAQAIPFKYPPRHSYRMDDFDPFSRHQLDTFRSSDSIYWAFPYLHFILMVPLLLVFFKRPTLRFNIWRLVSIWIIFPTITFFSFSNDRIFNLFEFIQHSLF